MVAGEDLNIATPLLNISVAVRPASDLGAVSSPSGTTIGGLSDAMPSNSSEPVSAKVSRANSIFLLIIYWLLFCFLSVCLPAFLHPSVCKSVIVLLRACLPLR